MILEHHQADRAALIEQLQAWSGWADWAEKHPAKELILKQILATAQLAHFPGAIIPRLQQGRMVYYAVADSEKQWRMLQGLLRSFVGTTLSDFRGLPAALDPADAFEALLGDRVTGPVGRFSPGGIRLLEQATVEALHLMVKLASGEGRLQRAMPRSTRQVLAEFRLALAGGNHHVAGEQLAFLREQMRLDALNLYFLEVERYQASQDWQGLVAAPFFNALTQARRPLKVTAALLEALYHTAVAPAVADGAVESLQTAFQERVRGPYGSLLKLLPPNPHTGVVLLFLLEAHAEQNPHAPAVAVAKAAVRSMSASEQAVTEVLLDSLAKLGGPVQQPVGASPNASPSPQGAVAVVMNALQADNLAAFEEALAYLQRMSEAERESLLQQRAFRALWQELLAAAGNDRIPASWIELLQALHTLRYAEVKALAERAQVEWSVAQQLKTPGDAAQLAAAIQEAWSAAAPEEVTALLPYLVEWVARDEAWPNPICLPLYEVLLLCLNLSDQHGQGLLDATSTLLHGCLKIGLSRPAYQTLLSDLGDRAVTVAGVNTVDWVLDLCEQTVIQPCPDPAVREALWTRTQAALVPVVSRMKPEQLALIDVITAAFGLVVTRQQRIASQQPATAVAPSGLLAIYTLQEGVAQRVEAILARVAPGLRVEVCSDLVATDRVKYLARTADQFVVCWQDAKHAVTQEVSRLRPRQQPVRWATGAGSSGVLRAVRECWPL